MLMILFVFRKQKQITVMKFRPQVLYLKFKKNRLNFSNKGLGGLIIGYKEPLHDHIKIIHSDSKYVLW